jgi:hypothetical protein
MCVNASIRTTAEYLHEARLFKKAGPQTPRNNPTHIDTACAKNVKKYMDPEMYDLYGLIWDRFMA